MQVAWFYGEQWRLFFGNDWPQQFCKLWQTCETYLNEFKSNLPACPCHLDQALADKALFMPETDCHLEGNASCIARHGGTCIRSVFPTENNISQQQCCYDQHTGYLMMAQDQLWGSRPRRWHVWGRGIWFEKMSQSTLLTWQQDIRPFYTCCLWQTEDSEHCMDYRLKYRPSTGCSSYAAPKMASVFSDSHVVTFNGFRYNFTGIGEFVLVRINDTYNLDIQGRFVQVKSTAHDDVTATKLNTIIAKGNNTDTVIEIALRNSYWNHGLDVYVNSRLISFDQISIKRFKGKSIHNFIHILIGST